MGGFFGAIRKDDAISDVFFGTDANLVFLAICGVIMSVISQIGDLIMSVIKRHYGIKDYGNLIPGHGGILDRFDSLVTVAPLMEALLLIAPVVI